MRLENNRKSFVLCLLAALTFSLSQGRAATVGQIWFGGQGPAVTTNSVTDNRVERINVDGSGSATAYASPNSNAFINVQLDTNAGLFFALSADGELTSGHMSVSALPHVYSGIGLSGLNYSAKKLGDAQYVAGNPDVAQLFTADAGTKPGADRPAVFIPGPFGILSNFSASYTLQSSSTPPGTSPYWALLVSPPNDSNPNDEVEIVQFSTGPNLDGDSRIHVEDRTGKLGSYFGTNFSDLINTSVGAYKFGDMIVDWAGVEIGEWQGGPGFDTNTAKANISSMTLTFVPSGTLDTIQITDNAANDLAYAMAVDPSRDIVYIGLWGADSQGADMIEVTYNPITGIMTSPYDYTTGTVSDPTHVLMNFIDTDLTFVMAREMWLAPGGTEIYYADNDFGDPGDFADQVQINGVYVVNTTDPQPIPQQLNDPSQFPVDNSQGYIVGMAVNQPKKLIYFATAGAAPGVGIASNTIWSMPIAGGTATAMPMPSGVSLIYPSDTGGCLALDADNQILYVSDQGQGRILKLSLSAKGTNFASGAPFFTLDSNHLTDGPNHFPSAFIHGMTFTTTTVVTPPPPATGALTIVRQGTNAIVSWPLEFATSTLQSGPVIGSTGWTNYPGPFVTNTTTIQTTSALTDKARFFRLSD